MGEQDRVYDDSGLAGHGSEHACSPTFTYYNTMCDAGGGGQAWSEHKRAQGKHLQGRGVDIFVRLRVKRRADGADEHGVLIL
jgi:hypothetical protein